MQGSSGNVNPYTYTEKRVGWVLHGDESHEYARVNIG